MISSFYEIVNIKKINNIIKRIFYAFYDEKMIKIMVDTPYGNIKQFYKIKKIKSAV